ncbi:MAG: hypothetical protein JXB33_01535 [Clostridia bacterium]|nr:hypothetical protein [Clostridia bacterium]
MKNFNGKYTGSNLSHIAFPLGGLGAGMICLQGNGMPGIFSIRNEPDVHFEPNVFSAVFIRQGAKSAARVLEGQIPYHKIFGGGGDSLEGAGNGLHGKNYGLPRFEENDFLARFPFATWNLSDQSIPLDVSLVGWSPFVPPDPDDSSLPVAALEYTFTNSGSSCVEAVYYFNSFNFMGTDRKKKLPVDKNTMRVFKRKDGFILNQQPLEDRPYMEGSFYASVFDENAYINADLYDGGHYDKLTMLWNDISNGRYTESEHSGNLSPGASISVPFTLNPGESKTIPVKLAWYVPNTTLRTGYESDGGSCGCSGGDCTKPTHKPWYAARYDDVENVMQYFSKNYQLLREKTALFSVTFFDSTLPDEVLEAVSANLSILKSPTILRQADGRLWCWEGCCDSSGCCSGSCTHVWNYAQALCHLFPSLERSLRETEFNECQNEEGHQTFRASLPIRESGHTFYAAADGQLGGIMKLYREWRISGDGKWIESYWDKMKTSLDYCIRTWDPKRQGVLSEPHHNTYDIEFWGPDGMCSSFYLGALKAAVIIGNELGHDVAQYRELFEKGRDYIEGELFNGEYFYQKVEWKTLEAKIDLSAESGISRQIIEREGPRYQYGTGCLSDGIAGAWLAKVCGLGDILDPDKIKSHLNSVYKYNLRHCLTNHANPQRPGFAIGNEGGLLVCTWPHGSRPTLPFIYCDEVFTGLEYQVASHLIMMGEVEKGLDIVRTCRGRYDGTKRNPFNEYECGHWYARALASYSLIEGFGGVRYDAVDKTLYINASKNDFKSFLCTATGYATAGMREGKPFYEVRQGRMDVENIICR